jgi:hypothetical protein
MLAENIISMYKPVEHNEIEGELYLTDSRFVWIETKAKGSLLGKIAIAAVMLAVVGGEAYAGGTGRRRIEIRPIMGAWESLLYL